MRTFRRSGRASECLEESRNFRFPRRDAQKRHVSCRLCDCRRAKREVYLVCRKYFVHDGVTVLCLFDNRRANDPERRGRRVPWCKRDPPGETGRVQACVAHAPVRCCAAIASLGLLASSVTSITQLEFGGGQTRARDLLRELPFGVAMRGFVLLYLFKWPACTGPVGKL